MGMRKPPPRSRRPDQDDPLQGNVRPFGRRGWITSRPMVDVINLVEKMVPDESPVQLHVCEYEYEDIEQHYYEPDEEPGYEVNFDNGEVDVTILVPPEHLGYAEDRLDWFKSELKECHNWAHVTFGVVIGEFDDPEIIQTWDRDW